MAVAISIAVSLPVFVAIGKDGGDVGKIARKKRGKAVGACGGEELEALDDILSKKVMRKLETQNPIYLRNASEGLVSYIDELFGRDAMPLCKEYIARIRRNA